MIHYPENTVLAPAQNLAESGKQSLAVKPGPASAETGESLVYQHFKCQWDKNPTADVLLTPGITAAIKGGYFLQDKAGA